MKFIKFCLSTLLALTLLAIVATANLKIILASPTAVQKILSESSVYPAVAAGLREGFVQANAGAEVPEGTLLEAANRILDDATVTAFMDDLTSQFNAAVKPGAKDRTITFRFSVLQSKADQSLRENGLVVAGDEIPKFAEDKVYDLNDNPAFWAILNINLLLAILSVLALALVGLMLLGGTLAQKFKWIASSFMVAGIVTLIEFLFVLLVNVERTFEYISGVSALENEKFLVALKKLLILSFEYEKFFLGISAGILILISIVLLVFSGITKKRSTEPVDFEEKEKKS